MTTFLKLLLIGIGVYLVLAFYIYSMQTGIIFYPDVPGRKLVTTPKDIGLDYHDVDFVSEDEVKLHGWFIPHKRAKGTLLFFHGNAGNISHRLESISIYHQLELNVFIIDYRGYGQSEGKVTEKGIYRDADAAWNYLTQDLNINDKQVIVFGRSLGASIASWLARKRSPAGLIIESGFTSVPAIGKQLYPFLPVHLLSRYKFDTQSYVKNVSCPVLVAHSRGDEIIPYDEGLKIYEAANRPKQLLEMSGGHNDGFIRSGMVYIKGLEEFIDESLNNS